MTTGRRLIAAAAAASTLADTGSSQAPPPAPSRTAPAAAHAELQGRIDVIPPPGQKPGLAGSVVWLPGVEAATDPGAGSPSMASRQKRFDPRVIAVPRDTEVTFPNVDSIYHNAFSLSPGNAFDLGLYRKGAIRTVTLQTPGLVRVFCNIHPEMAGYVMVVEGRAFAVTDPDGRYVVARLPPGRRRVVVWNEMAGEQRHEVELIAGGSATLSLTLDASSYRREQHKNKHGKDYPPVAGDVDRY